MGIQTRYSEDRYGRFLDFYMAGRRVGTMYETAEDEGIVVWSAVGAPLSYTDASVWAQAEMEVRQMLRS